MRWVISWSMDKCHNSLIGMFPDTGLRKSAICTICKHYFVIRYGSTENAAIKGGRRERVKFGRSKTFDNTCMHNFKNYSFQTLNIGLEFFTFENPCFSVFEMGYNYISNFKMIFDIVYKFIVINGWYNNYCVLRTARFLYNLIFVTILNLIKIS